MNIRAQRARGGRVVALLGAESTGKTTLAALLCESLRADGHRCALVEEALREFCNREGRTPRIDEQSAIADEQTRRIELARAGHDLVIADTTALQIAVYSELIFGDRSLYERTEDFQRSVDLTLLMALDLPWVADGLQRDGPHVRAPVDVLVRAALQRAGVCYAVVSGEGAERLANALAAVRHMLRDAGRRTSRDHVGEPRAVRERRAGIRPDKTHDPGTQAAGERVAEASADGNADAGVCSAGERDAAGWQHVCERCGDPQCERRLLPRP